MGGKLTATCELPFPKPAIVWAYSDTPMGNMVQKKLDIRYSLSSPYRCPARRAVVSRNGANAHRGRATSTHCKMTLRSDPCIERVEEFAHRVARTVREAGKPILCVRALTEFTANPGESSDTIVANYLAALRAGAHAGLSS